MNFRNLRILCIFAHREDHVLFGWPILQYKYENKYLFIVSNDAMDIITKSCANWNVNYRGPGILENSFSINKIPCAYQIIRNKIKSLIGEIKPDYIFTHNPIGEYGHYDHRMVFEVIYNETKTPIIINDILASSSYYNNFEKIPLLFKNLYINKICKVNPNIKFYNDNRELFIKNDKWTNNNSLNPPLFPRSTSLYEINTR